MPKYAAVNLGYALLAALWIAFVAVRSPTRRRVQACKAALLAVTVAVIGFVHVGYAQSTRASAQQAVDALLSFKTHQGRFPRDAVEAGIETAELESKYVFVRWASEGEPVVIYNSTFIPFDTYHFDFATRTWVFHPD